MAENTGNFSFSQEEFESFLQVLRGAAETKPAETKKTEDSQQLRELRIQLIRILDAIRAKEESLEREVEYIFKLMGSQKAQEELEAQKQAQEAEARRQEEARRLEAERKAQEEALARQLAEQKRQEEEARRQAEEAYRAQLADWEAACAEITQQQEQQLLERLRTERERREAQAYAAYDEIIKDGMHRKLEAKDRKAAAEAELRTLGMLQFARKEAVRHTITEAQALITRLEQEMAQADQTLTQQLEAIPEVLKGEVESIRSAIRLEIPFPPKPKMP